MKTSVSMAALALAVLALAPRARADEAKTFKVAAATGLEKSGPIPRMAGASDLRAKPQDAPIVIEILSAVYLPDQDAAAELSPPSKPAKRR